MRERLDKPIEKQINQSNRYHLKEFLKGCADCDGIINYLRKQTNNQFENEIKIAPSSIHCNENDYGPYNSIQYENQNYCLTDNFPNSWICFEFKNHQIIPTHYTSRSGVGGFNAPFNYKIEVSEDNSTSYEIDRQNGGPFTDGNQETLTLPIDKNNKEEAKYLCLTQTGKNTRGSNYLVFESIEFYEYLHVK